MITLLSDRMNIRLSQMFVYPVKSLGSCELESVVVERRGLRTDRRLMVVKPDGGFITQREYPELASITVEIDGPEIVLRHGDKAELRLCPDDLQNTAQETGVRVWESDVLAVSAGRGPGRWISEFLGTEAVIVFMPDSAERPISDKFNRGSDIVSFADGYPLLLVNAASLRALNDRLEVGVTVDRFRPNLVVEGADAFSEDRWMRIRIGNAEFRVVKPCARCVVTTVDQRTGVADSREPLRTLAGFRMASRIFPDSFSELGLEPNDVLFGVNLIPEAIGARLTSGERIEVALLD